MALRTSDFYEQMKKYEYLFIYSNQSHGILHLYRVRNNTYRVTMCNRSIPIQLCYNPETEPRHLTVCSFCEASINEAFREKYQQEALSQLPSILSRKRSQRTTQKEIQIDDELDEETINERLSQIKIDTSVSLVDPDYPPASHIRFTCSYCAAGIREEKVEPCSSCRHVFHSYCLVHVRWDIYRQFNVFLSPHPCVSCFVASARLKKQEELLPTKNDESII